VDVRRDLGGVIFIDLRDRYGTTQVVFNPQHNEDAHQLAKDLRSEYVISVTGLVENRPEGTANPDLATGEIDVRAEELTILNRADTPPFPITGDVEAGEDTRLKFRYLDLRRPALQRNLIFRHELYQLVHKFFDENGFIEVETPILMKSTPKVRVTTLSEPCTSRPVLRVAAIAPDLQAAADGVGHGPVRADREMLQRRRSACRPPTGVHTDRRRNVVHR